MRNVQLPKKSKLNIPQGPSTSMGSVHSLTLTEAMGMKPFQWAQDNPDSFQETVKKAQGAFFMHMQMTAANIWIQAGWKDNYVLVGRQLCPGSWAAQKRQSSF